MSSQRPAESSDYDAIAILLQEQFSRLSRQLRNFELPPGMTPERLSALAVIDKYGPISVTSLADKERVRPATMSRMVSALVDEGVVKRSDDKADGRGVLVSVTQKGRRIFQKAQQSRLQHLSNALRVLTAEQLAAMQGLAAALERLSALLDQPRTV